MEEKSLFNAFRAFCAACNDYVFLSVGFVEQAGYEMAVLQRNGFVANGTDSFQSWFWGRVAVGTAVYGAQLVRYVHRPVNTAYKVFSWQKHGVAEGA